MIDDHVIDQIYEAAVIPELWPSVLDQLAPLAECEGGFLFVADEHQRVHGLATERYVPLLTNFITGGWMARNLRAPRVAAMKYPGFVVDLDIVTMEEVQNDPFYTEFLHKYHGGWGTGAVIPIPSGDLLVFDLERSFEKGPVERRLLPALDSLRPHLARAGLMSARLQLKRAQEMTETLGLLRLPAVILRRNGRVIAQNSLFAELTDQFIVGAFDVLALANQSSDQLLKDALAQVTTRVSRSIPVPRQEDKPAFVAHLVPIRRAAGDIFSGAEAILVVTPLSMPSAPSEDVLNGLFDLTPAEVRVTQGIVRGETVEQLALSLGLSRETIRSQLKAAMAKTGTARQVELVGLLSGGQIRVLNP